MKVIINFNDPAVNSNQCFPHKLNFKINKLPPVEQEFVGQGTACLDENCLRKDKANVLLFRFVDPNEAETKRKNAFSNALRFVLFVIMAIFLPVSFMSFKGNNNPYKKIKFKFDENSDLVLNLTPFGYSFNFQPAAPAPAPVEPFPEFNHSPNENTNNAATAQFADNTADNTDNTFNAEPSDNTADNADNTDNAADNADNSTTENI